MTEQIAIVKVAAGFRIPLTYALAKEMDLQKGDYVTIYRNDAGEIAIGKPQLPQMDSKTNESAAIAESKSATA